MFIPRSDHATKESKVTRFRQETNSCEKVLHDKEIVTLVVVSIVLLSWDEGPLATAFSSALGCTGILPLFFASMKNVPQNPLCHLLIHL